MSRILAKSLALVLCFGASVYAQSKDPLELIPPLTNKIFPNTAAISGELISSKATSSVLELQDALVGAAIDAVELDYVPYVWGGGRIGSQDECQACRDCVAARKVSLTNRLNRCSACRRCGMDCSHFINYVFNKVGIDVRYASSSELGRQSDTGLMNHYGFIDVGTDLSLAQPGDILVYPKHVAMLVRVISETHGDIVHSTRFRVGDYLKLGGIRHDRFQNLKKYRGKLRRILRHYDLFSNPANFSKDPLPPVKSMPLG